MARMLLPVTVRDLPARFCFQPDGSLREKLAYSIAIGVTKVIAGPEKCHVTVDVKRPYFLPVPSPEIIIEEETPHE